MGAAAVTANSHIGPSQYQRGVGGCPTPLCTLTARVSHAPRRTSQQVEVSPLARDHVFGRADQIQIRRTMLMMTGTSTFLAVKRCRPHPPKSHTVAMASAMATDVHRP